MTLSVDISEVSYLYSVRIDHYIAEHSAGHSHVSMKGNPWITILSF